MKTRIFLLAVIALLVLLNLGTLTFMWLHRPGRPDHRTVIDPTLFIAKKLDLDKEQRATFRHLRIQYRARMDVLEARDRALHNRFFDLAMQHPVDSLRSVQIADSIAFTRREMELLTLLHFSEMRRRLDDDQRRKFDTVFYDALKIVLPPPPPPPPPSAAPPPPPLPDKKNKIN